MLEDFSRMHSSKGRNLALQQLVFFYSLIHETKEMKPVTKSCCWLAVRVDLRSSSVGKDFFVTWPTLGLNRQASTNNFFFTNFHFFPNVGDLEHGWNPKRNKTWIPTKRALERPRALSPTWERKWVLPKESRGC